MLEVLKSAALGCIAILIVLGGLLTFGALFLSLVLGIIWAMSFGTLKIILLVILGFALCYFIGNWLNDRVHY